MNENHLELNEESKLVLKSHLGKIEKQIVNYAHEIAKDENEEDVSPAIILKAALLYAPGKKYYNFDNMTLGKRIVSSISGITIITAILAIIFGLIGAFVNSNDGSWIDIAKIFAGAIVGSTGANVVRTYQT
ncbi:MAG: hypothetical protein H6690_00250 [Erysipelotrichaceae bacterium]|nr:hypothetical protein [Ignavibacteriales bacterium]MCB9499680.1 hypothetical protein [Erysipelotrichaceae bacterium]